MITYCNEWECKYNKNGQCETVQRMSECIENAVHEMHEEKEKKCWQNK